MGQESRTDLEESVLKTVIWFSQFSYPLTVFEIWKWLFQPKRAYGLGEVYAILERSNWLRERLENEKGFYALKGSGIEQLIEGRQDKFLDAERKFKLLRRVAMYFSVLPAIGSVAAANTLAWWSTNKTSDIDLYVITKPGHIWSSRFWLVVPFALVGRRPSRAQTANVPDAFCFSFFSTKESLNLEEFCLPRDYYMAFWIRSLVPILDRDGDLEIMQTQNRWASKMLPNAYPRCRHHLQKPLRVASVPVQWRFLEPLFRTLERHRLPSHLRDIANSDSRVVLTDETLKFHDNDRRAHYRDTFETLLEQHL